MALRRMIVSGLAALLVVMMSLPGMCAACAARKSAPSCEESHAIRGAADPEDVTLTSERASPAATDSSTRSCEDCGANHELMISAMGMRHGAPELDTRLANCDGVSCKETAERLIIVERGRINLQGGLQSQNSVVASEISGHAAHKELLDGWRSRNNTIENFAPSLYHPLSVSLKI
jgi:hypothetical protein